MASDASRSSADAESPTSPEPPETGESVADAEAAPAEGKAEDKDRPWWEDERMPWQGQPTKADIGCWSAITAVGIFALVMLPLRPVLLGYTPYLLVALTGSRTGMVTIGALGATGNPWWPLGLVIGIISIIKFDLIYFWAGKLWGRGVLEVFGGRSPRARRNAERAERLAWKYASPAVVLTYLPIPIPAAVIYATLAMAGMSWRKFILVNLACATVLQIGWLALGWALGAPAVRVVEIYAQYSMYLSLAILAGMIAVMVWRSKKGDRRTPAGDAS
ncbi:DedA family protein [Enemella sp. A6]|uniref:DedA family protein n=1 Tax=Enemella sp. A6 TaxID=3440152 RepID=UPI003EBBFF49